MYTINSLFLITFFEQKSDKKEDIPDDIGSGRKIPVKQVWRFRLYNGQSWVQKITTKSSLSNDKNFSNRFLIFDEGSIYGGFIWYQMLFWIFTEESIDFLKNFLFFYVKFHLEKFDFFKFKVLYTSKDSNFQLIFQLVGPNRYFLCWII